MDVHLDGRMDAGSRTMKILIISTLFPLQIRIITFMVILVETQEHVTAQKRLIVDQVPGQVEIIVSRDMVDRVLQDFPMALSTGTTRITPTLTQNGVYFQMESTAGTQKYSTVAGLIALHTDQSTYPQVSLSISTSTHRHASKYVE